MQHNYFRNFKILPTAIVSVVLAISACGGGGSTTARMDGGQNPAQTSVHQAFARVATTNEAQQNVSTAASSEPRQGSVTQSSNAVGGVTANSLSISVTRAPQNGVGFTIRETGAGAHPNFLSSGTQGVEVNADTPDRTGFQPVQANSESNNRRIWTLIFTNINTITNADHNANRWLAGGLYIESTGQGQNRSNEFGAFFNGGQPFTTNNIRSLSGTATYEGEAVGIGRISGFGSTDGQIIAFASDEVRLTAEFGDATALGSISGRITGIEFAPDSADAEELDGTLTLGTAQIGNENSGFFKGDTSYREGDWTGSGKWGGQFYNNGDFPGNVGGTFGLSFSNLVENTSGELIGVFGADRQQ